ncbi:hypothetical protein HAX54_028206 [Datura stramonium]|uniref:Uncharacterized protein n=1 Tax=Datura stramonium TaxID=4076 RepID=A0ABS8V3R7_DATST|nr:hypothetical protein [Datura stramonium]
MATAARLASPCHQKREESVFHNTVMYIEYKNAIVASVNGVDFIVDVVSLGQILRVLMNGISTVKDQVVSRNFMNMIGKLKENLNQRGLGFVYLLTCVFKQFEVAIGKGMVVTRKKMFTEEQNSKGTFEDLGDLKESQLVNAQLKAENAGLRKKVEDLTQQMLQDQRAINERIDKLLSKL